MHTVFILPSFLYKVMTHRLVLIVCFTLFAHSLVAQSATEYFSLGKQKRAHGKYAEAVTNFDRALELDKTLVQAYELRGYCYARLRKHQKALDDYNQAIAMGYETPLLYLNRGWAYYNLNNRDEACLSWEKSNLMGYQKVIGTLKKYCGF